MSQRNTQDWVAPPSLGTQRWTRARLAWLGAAAVLTAAGGGALWALWAPLPGQLGPASAPPSGEEAQPIVAASPSMQDVDAVLFSEEGHATLARRQHLLNLLREGGNIFAANRQPWPEPAEQAQEEQTPAVTLGAPPPPPPTLRDDDGRLSLESIPLTPISNKLPPALYQQVKAMKLEVLYGQESPSRSQPQLGAVVRVAGSPQLVHEGEEIAGENGAWRVLAIDMRNNRVILSRDGYNVALVMPGAASDAVAVAAQKLETPSRSRRPVVVKRSVDEARSELSAAGLAQWEIEAVLRLAQRLDDESAATAPTTQASPGQGTAAPAKVAAPPALAELLKLMATGQAPEGAAAAQPRGAKSDSDPKQPEDPRGGASPS
ncbi:MAG: hypothetical protein D6824_00645 [Planctomycetota bacterium]|nr:MAG: hypothetical protein D6824_00645 [Planctomycetota bacterium]